MEMFPTAVLNTTLILFLNHSITNDSYTNTTLSTSTTPIKRSDTELNPYLLVLVEVTCILVFFLGLIGNTLVLLVFGSRWSKLKVCEVFMMNLAFSDLIATIVVPIKMFLELVETNFHPIGDSGCKILAFLSMTTITVSSLTLLVISIDRFIIVKWPLRKNMENWQITLTIFITWFLAASLSFVFLLPNRIGLHDDPHDSIGEIHFCRSFMNPHENEPHTLVAFTIQIVVPLVSMTVLYCLIVCELRKVAACQIFARNEHEMRIRLKRNRKATKLFVTIVTIFYIFVLPSNIFFLVYIFGTIDMPMNQLFIMYTALQMILILNSCSNPLIYSNLHTSFRRQTLRLLCSCIFSRFKRYQWGDSVRSMIRSSKRSVRGSFQSSRDLLSNLRRKSADDANSHHNNNIINAGMLKYRMDNRYSATYSPSQLSTVTAFEDFDRYSLHDMKTPTTPSARSPILEEEKGDSFDNVFDSDSNSSNGTNEVTVNGYVKNSSGSINSNGKTASPLTKQRHIGRNNRKKLLRYLKDQSTVEEEF